MNGIVNKDKKDGSIIYVSIQNLSSILVIHTTELYVILES